MAAVLSYSRLYIHTYHIIDKDNTDSSRKTKDDDKISWGL